MEDAGYDSDYGLGGTARDRLREGWISIKVPKVGFQLFAVIAISTFMQFRSASFSNAALAFALVLGPSVVQRETVGRHDRLNRQRIAEYEASKRKT